MPEIRAARREDAERCAALCREALDRLQEQRGGALLARRELGLVARALVRPGGMDRLLADARRRIVVSCLDGVVVGLALGRVEEVGGASIGIIEGCYVEPPARRAGAGRALVGALVDWFGAAGCRGVDAGALPGDRAAKSLLEASGFKARLITMHRSEP
ncbi:MAG TPA: GNAT family N-acetyltransferase [Acidimicrobiales bacterium]|nr:GNAT family N-acetyltransferase [Acidimicrobiales bacterium]